MLLFTNGGLPPPPAGLGKGPATCSEPCRRAPSPASGGGDGPRLPLIPDIPSMIAVHLPQINNGQKPGRVPDGPDPAWPRRCALRCCFVCGRLRLRRASRSRRSQGVRRVVMWRRARSVAKRPRRFNWIELHDPPQRRWWAHRVGHRGQIEALRPLRGYEPAKDLNSSISPFTAAATILPPASTVACDGSEPMRPSGKRRR
jgi:hypothetical protein